VVYTSGSTGTPKGVVVTHGGLANLVDWHLAEFGVTSADRATQLAGLGFDASVWESWPYLAAGATLHLVADEETRASPEALRGFLLDRGITLAFVPTPLAERLLGLEWPRDAALRALLTGGDALRARPAADLPFVLVNAYGPTENTVVATAGEVAPDGDGRAPGIGQPIRGVRGYVLGPGLNPVPSGVPGELHLAGDGLARGYLGRPAATAGAFLPCPFGGAGERMYATGDRVRRLASGELEFLGRVDHQVKLRGFRIEPGEIESVLLRDPRVRECVAAVRADGAGERRIVAWVAGADLPGAEELRARLRESLPDYMVPSAFVALERLPLTPSGKTDRAALPDPAARDASGGEHAAPRTPEERALAEAWQEVLGVERVGIHEHFFELGGDSIQAVRVATAARRAGLRVLPRQLFEHTTIAELARVAGNGGAAPAEQGPVVGTAPLTPIQRGFFADASAAPHHFNQALLLVPARPLDPRLAERALAALADHHDALRLRFRREEEGWTQLHAPAGERVPLGVVDLSRLDAEDRAGALAGAADRVQAGLHVERGPLARAAQFRLGDGGPGRLLLVLHHLVVDGGAWRILLDDLATAYGQLERGEPVRLPAKTTSWKAWAERLAEHARAPETAAEARFWTSQAFLDAAELPLDDPQGEDTVGRAASVAVQLGPDETAALLRDVVAAYGVRADEVLLAALARVVARWTGERSVRVELEGNSREEARFAELDPSRTVGWLTHLYPVLLELPEAGGAGEALRAVAEQLREVPGGGLGHGLLRWASGGRAGAALASAPRPELAFGYVGQLEETVAEHAFFRLAPEPAGAMHDPRRRRAHRIEVTAAVRGGRLTATFGYGAAVHRRATIERLAAWYAEELRGLIGNDGGGDGGGGPGGRAPGDFPLAGLDGPELEALVGSDPGVEDVYPLTPMQEGMHFHSLLAPGSGVYVGQFGYLLEGPLDAGALERAWRGVVARHEALRAGFAWEDLPRPVQVVRREAALPFRVEDWRGLAGAERQAQLERWLEADREAGFDTRRAPLMRVGLFRLDGEEHQMVWTHHHLVMDGWSVPLLLRDVLAIYAAHVRGEEPRLPPAVRFRDYVAWLERQDRGRAERFWREALAGFHEPTPLPASPPPAGGEGQGTAALLLPVERSAALQERARRWGVTLGTLVQGAWALLLSRCTGEDDVLFGATVSGRPAELEGAEEIVGLFINTLPVRVRLRPEATLGEWLAELQRGQVEAREYEYSPLVEVRKWSAVPSGRPLFESLVVFENLPVDPAVDEGAGGIAGVRVRSNLHRNQTNFPLSLVAHAGAQLTLEISHDRARVDAEAAERLAGHLETLLEGMVARPQRRLAEVGLLRDSERARVLEAWNATAAPAPEACVHELFEAQAERTPGAVAVVSGEATLSYAELDERANRLARRLVRLGVGPEARVALCLERGPEMMVAVLAILKAGGAYVPLDPAYPAERLAYMLEDSAARVLLTQRSLAGRLPEFGGETVVLDGAGDGSALPHSRTPAPSHSPSPDNLAYVVYTSGSTGRPKGVAMPHRPLANLLAWQRGEWRGPAGAVTLQFTTISFDVAFQEIFSCWCAGGRLVLVGEEARRDPAGLLEVLERQGVERLFMPPVALQRLAEEAVARGAVPGGLREVVTAGEALRVTEAMRRWFGALRVPLHNQYGPSETHVATAAVLEGGAEGWPLLPGIGGPIANGACYVVDRDLEPVPVGVGGELYVGGLLPARGYLDRPELTAERFVPDPFSRAGGARMYRTGDRVRWLADGTLEFLGRTDAQVKVSGFRIEPGEIEAALEAHPRVREAAVVAREDASGERRLVGYVVPAAGAEVTPAGLRAHLQGSLPEHMVPRAFVVLDAFPLTPSGKVDRRALPEPEVRGEEEYAAPRTPGEELLAGIWAEVLGVERVGTRDDFFALGGHSLLATRVVSRVRETFGVELPLQALFAAPTVAALARRVDAARGADAPAAPPIRRRPPGEGPAPLSFAQQRLWFVHQLDPRSSAYNLPHALRLRGALDVRALRRGVTELARRHQAVRTVLVAGGGEPVQVVLPAAPVPCPVLDLAPLPEEARFAEAMRRLDEEGRRPFDLARGPLLRMLLVRLAGDDWILCFTMHHVATDGWSMGVLVREVSALYGAFSRGEPSPLPEPELQYADFAAWQREWLRGEALEAQLGYWRERLAGLPPTLALPLDRPRRDAQGATAKGSPFELPAELTQGLRRLGRGEGATLFMTLLAGWQTLLGRWAGQDDVVVGTAIAGRTRAELEGLIGFFVNSLVLRADLSGDPGFSALLGQVRETTLGAFAHQDLPFERLVEELAPERSLAHNPLFQVMFALQNMDRGVLTLGDVEVEGLGGGGGEAKFDVSVALFEDGERVLGHVEYRSDLFDAATMERMAGHFRLLLEGAVADPAVRVHALPLVGPAERAEIVERWSGAGEAAGPPARCVHELFAEQAARTPGAVAVVSGDERLTYAELDRRANDLARLLARRGVGPDVRVAICAERSPEMVVGLLATLKAGGAYVPLDPAYPPERLAYMLADAAARVLLVQPELLERLPEHAADVVLLDAAGDGGEPGDDAGPPAVAVTPEHLAYVIYTSGSTGTPKGTEVPHRAIPGFFRGVGYARFDADQVLLQHSSPSWDAMTLELWPALLTGGTCVLYPGRTPDPAQLAEQVRAHGVTTLWLTATFFNLVVDTCPEVLAGVAQVMVGGEAVSVPHVRRALRSHPGLRLVNGYGPSETTVFAACHPVPADFDAPAVPIGRPVGDRRVYLLDGDFAPVPVGVGGELCIGGPAVARGYRGRPGLTAERFVPDPFSATPGARMYRSGDRARWRADGVLDFVGRMDGQVKLRGFRIEPGEVEAALRAHPGVRDAAVALREDRPGQGGLVGYHVPAAGEPAAGTAELRAFLRSRLPEHLVPGAFVALDRLPLTPGGKLDRRALPAPGAGPDGAERTPPRTPLEAGLARVFAEVLELETVGVEESFFELGGHSLLATRVISGVRDRLGAELPLRALFEAPTVAGLAGHVEAALGTARSAPGRIPRRADDGPAPLSFAQQRLWFFHQLDPRSSAYNMPFALRLRGRLDVRALRRSLGEVVRRHEAVRTVLVAGGGEPVQVVLPAAPVPCPVLDLAPLPEEARFAEAMRRLDEEGRRPFDLARGPLLRMLLVRLAEEDWVLCFTMHHVVGDGWSTGVLTREVSALYGAFSRGEASPLPEPELQYADFAAWQRERLRGEALEAQLGYWRDRLAGLPPTLALPLDRPRRDAQGATAKGSPFELPAELTRALRRLGRGEGATLFMTLLAGWQTLLGRWAGQDDVVVGTAIAGRTRAELEGLIGFFVNSLVLRADLGGDPGFRALLGQVRETTLGAFAHQDLPFERLVEELAPERSLAHNPLFQVMFALQNMERGVLTLGDVEVEGLGGGGGEAKFDVSVALFEDGERVLGHVEYRSDLFDAATVERMAGHFRLLLEGAVADPDGRVHAIPLVGPAERAEIVERWSGAAEAAESPARCVHELFAEQAARTPGAVAVVAGDERLTYAELDRRSARLANHLRRRGAGPEVPVALLLDRSAAMVVAVLGVLRAGAAYLPLDPHHPRERLRGLLAEAGAPLLLTRAHLAARVAGSPCAVVRLDADAAAIAAESDAAPAVPVDARNAAYVIHTSGSTGTPRGVVVEHGGLANYLRFFEREVLGERGFALPMVSRLAFDAHVRQLFPPLLRGGAAWVLAEETATDPAALLEALSAEERVSFGGVPSLWSAVLERVERGEAAAPRGLAAVLLGGEALPDELVRRTRAAFPGVAVWNHYGPTEATVNTTVARVDGAERVSLGRPIAGARVYVVDVLGSPVPAGVAGELYVGGAGVARGYLGRPGLTAERFLPDPLGTEAGARLYRTGDRVRWLPGGELEYLGRADHQVKVRGFRVELGEIEAALRSHGQVREAVVLLREDAPGGQQLVAYVTGRAGERIAPGELREHLAERLPEHMVPAAIVPLERMPVTSGGKVDRGALPAPERTAEEEHVAPRTEVEERVAAIWAEVLGLETVGVEESFFELGGHSLLATRVISAVRKRLGAELPLRALFEAPTVAGLAGRVEAALGAARSAPGRILRRADDGPAPLSFAQQRLWFFQQLDPRSSAYNMPFALRLRGRLDVRALRRSLGEVVRRHEAVRTVLVARGGTPVQVVLPAAPVPLPVLDLAGLPPEARERETMLRLAEEGRRPFDLERGPLLRALLVRGGDGEWALGFTMHHVVGDGWSTGVLIREVSALYGAFARGEASPLPEPELQYADFAAWQREWLRGEALEAQLGYWRERLAGLPPTLALPFDRPRRDAQGSTAKGSPFELPAGLTRELRRLGRGEGATLFMTLLAGWQALLGRWAGQDDVVVGTAIAGRTRAELEGLIGFFVNSLVLRADLSGDPGFRALLGQVRETTLGAFAHQDLPFERLVEELAPERSLAHNPLFQVMFALQNMDRGVLTLGDVEVEALGGGGGEAKFDVSVALFEDGERVLGHVEYRSDLFDASTIEHMAGRFRLLLEGAAANPDGRVHALPLLRPAERAEIVERWSRRGARFEPGECLHDRFRGQAARTPGATAVSHGGAAVTYAELERRAGLLAARLRGLGVGPEARVGLCLERSPELVAAMLGVLAAGGAYVPLDPGYPAERIALLLEDSGVAVVVAQEATRGVLAASPVPVVLLDELLAGPDAGPGAEPAAAVSPGNAAYVIYTSGSTGRPKGVVVTHANALRLFDATERWFGFGPDDVWTLFHSFAFDFSVWEIWGALLYGGRLVVVPDEVRRDPEAFRELLGSEGVTVLNQTPSAFRQLVRADEAAGAGPGLALRWVVFGGEALEPRSLAPWFARHGDRRPRLVNMYGITETTVHVTFRELAAEDVEAGRGSVIGDGLPDLGVYLLDAALEPVPAGVPGELFVGGAGVARGYLGRPELTAERFVPDPFSAEPGARMYRSGDRARLHAGETEYLGRADQQVKVRGFRIEPGEIEAALATLPGVREAVVVPRDEDGGLPRLVAYVAMDAAPGGGGAASLRAALAARLPGHMVPAAFVLLDALPLTPHGKVDRRALPAPDGAWSAAAPAYVPPRGPAEEALAQVWAETLGVERVGANDNFFALGGDSMRAIQVMAQARSRGVGFSLQELFRHQTVAELAERIEPGEPADRLDAGPFALLAAEDRERLPEGVEDAYPMAQLQLGMLFDSESRPDGTVYIDILSFPVYAAFDEARLRGALAALGGRHPILRTSFDLSGFSEPLQLVHREVEIPLAVTSLEHLSPEAQEAAVEAWVEAERRRALDWRVAPLIRYHVHVLGPDAFHFGFTEHHAILDGWSVAALQTELFGLYFDGAGAQGDPPPPSVFRDFVALEREVLDSAEARRFWAETLEESAPTLPASPGPTGAAGVGARREEIPAGIVAGLTGLARREGLPLKSLLLAAHLRVLAAASGADDVTTGLVSNGRPEGASSERALGLFLNTVPLRLRLSGGSWRELAHETFREERRMLPFRRFPLAELQRMRGGDVPVAALFNFIHFHVMQGVVEDAGHRFGAGRGSGGTKFPFSTTFQVHPGGMQLLLKWDAARYSDAAVERMFERYLDVLGRIAGSPDGAYDAVDLLSDAERAAVTAGWTSAGAPAPGVDTLHGRFAAQAVRTPDAVAVECGGERLTYAELDRRSAGLAGALRRRGVRPETRVAVCLERSADAVVALLGVLRAGGAWLPLDPDDSPERLAWLVADAAAPVVVTGPRLAGRLAGSGAEPVRVDADRADAGDGAAGEPGDGAGPENLAYVIYTSGSTGTPKGVGVTHRSACRHLEWIADEVLGGEADILPATSRFSFDASLKQLLGPLLRGGTAWILDERTVAEPAAILRELHGRGRVAFNCVPSLWSAVLDAVEAGAPAPRDLRRLLLGGEAFGPELVRRSLAAFPELEVWNLYGPTETTVNASAGRVAPGAAPTIGRPAAYARAYVVDGLGGLAAPGVPGELWVGGEGVARGYLGRPELTAARFTPDPFAAAPGARLYRTGDRVRRLPSGELEFLGRIDQQVKVRGFRVEPGEVAAALALHPAVRDAAVVARADGAGQPRLVAYLVPAAGGAAPGAAELRAHLRARLPEYMVPSAFVAMDALPLTSRGKLDRRALPEPETAREEGSYVAPRDALELRLAGLWEELLGVRPVGVRDDFFALGGHSLLALRLVAAAERLTGRRVPMATLLAGPTVEQLARELQGGEAPPSGPLVPIQPSGGARPLFFVHAAGGGVVGYAALGRHLGAGQPLYGLQSRGVEGEEPPHVRIEEMAADYLAQLRAVQGEGPYRLGGWSMGGLVAFEMARQLEAAGDEVELLALVDPTPPSGGEGAAPREADDPALLAGFALHLELPVERIALAPEEILAAPPAERPRRAWEAARAAGAVPDHLDRARFERLWAVFRANAAASAAYRPAPCASDLLLVLAEDRGEPAARDVARWEGLTTGTVRSAVVPGDHFTLVREPRVREVAALLTEALAHAAASAGIARADRSCATGD
jgi:amino acid adenylation domain-containing protein/non-ribosomal peptide synthase protein (TIGR01720 family)